MIQRIYHQQEINFHGYSDYGRAFQEFDAQASHIVDQKTILLIIGDARNNKRNPRLDLLQKWSTQARKILWFNPDPFVKWDQGDSIIGIYRQAIHHAYEISTPGKLVQAIEQVVL